LSEISENSFNINISKNVKSLRAKRNYTQGQLAKLAQIPRTTLTNIESGESNPSLSNVIKLANALNVGLDLLVSSPRPETILIRNDELPFENKSGATIIKILPDTSKDIDVDRVTLGPHDVFRGSPHLSGTKEYMTVISGEVIVRLFGQEYHLHPGDLLAFPGDVPHSYHNPIGKDSQYFSIIVPS
jgi:transcriptional regulator with XRE-family HTH domain